ncbi:MAG: diphosphomevalonate decarboxylase, partial [Pseudomonadota bacterium]
MSSVQGLRSESSPTSARAYANFALVKYWGKRDVDLNLPDVGSLSITLDALHTTTTVVLDPDLDHHQLVLNGERHADAEVRAQRVLELMRSRAGSDSRCRISSRNNFPTAAGLASSASGFAALVQAATQAYGLEVSPAQCSEWARLGSGSAARSMFGGYVEMARGTLPDGSDSVAQPIASADHWPLEVVVAISQRQQKPVGSTEGMLRTAQTSPFYRAWVD